MANNIALAELYKAALDEIYKRGSLTAALETSNSLVQPTDDPGIVKVAKMVLQGLGDYSRSTGYVQGDVTMTWEPFALPHDRGRSFQVDAMDEREAISAPLLSLVNEFMTQHVIPEVDAIRFAAMAAGSGATVAANLADSAAAAAAWKTARQYLDEKEVPEDNRIAFMSNDFYYKLEENKLVRERLTPAEGSDSRFATLDGITVVKVPQNRFQTKISLLSGNSGQVAGGFTKASGSLGINFQLVHTQAAAAVTKHALPRIFGPDVNQQANATRFDYRIYHGLIVPDNKKNGIYTHTKAA